MSAADLGFLTSVYFRFRRRAVALGPYSTTWAGPSKRLPAAAGVGALVFALTEVQSGLVIAGPCWGLGVALAMAGLKAIVLWFRPTLALASGWLVMLGAQRRDRTAPAELVVRPLAGAGCSRSGRPPRWRRSWFICVPERTHRALTVRDAPAGLLAIYRDQRFGALRRSRHRHVLVATGLWAAPWLCDVDGLDRASVVRHLTVMAIAVCVSALLLGVVADRLRQRGVKTELVLVSTLGVSMTAQAGLLLQWPLPSYVLWGTIAAAGAATVLSFGILTEYFPKEISGRANAAPQSAARRWRIRPAVRNRPRHRGVARGPWDLSSRSAPGGYGPHACPLQLSGARLVCHAAARLPAPTMARAVSRDPFEWPMRCRQAMTLTHVRRWRADTTFGSRPQPRAGLTCRKRIGDALHRSGGGAFHDDQSSGSGYPHLRDRPLAHNPDDRGR